MKNIKIKEISKKGMAFVAALVMHFTGAALTNNAKAEGYTLVPQEVITTPMDMEAYTRECNVDAEYLSPEFIQYDHLFTDNECLEFLTNITLLPQEVKQELVDKGIVFKVDFETYQGMELFGYAYNLINMISEYNQSEIKEDHSRNLIDASILCYDEHDAKIVHSMHDNYFNAYVTGMQGEKGTLIENEYYIALFKQLFDLNAAEQKGNAHELSVGARWLALNIYGNGIRQLIYDYIQEHYSPAEIYQYFDQGSWNAQQIVRRTDITVDTNCLKNELEVLYCQVGQIEVFIYQTINNDIFKEVENFGRKCR